MRPDVRPTGIERKFQEDEILVSKTNLKGIITYANSLFCRLSDYSEEEIIGKPHNVIRHPGMPRAMFKVVWDTIQAGQECFAYVVNMAKNGDHYWVFAHITPTFDEQGQIIGYHSNRRAVEPASLERAQKLYTAMLAEERKHGEDWRAGMHASGELLNATLRQRGMEYDEFVFSL
jgi:PAS domain S-box-containing protein